MATGMPSPPAPGGFIDAPETNCAPAEINMWLVADDFFGRVRFGVWADDQQQRPQGPKWIEVGSITTGMNRQTASLNRYRS